MRAAMDVWMVFLADGGAPFAQAAYRALLALGAAAAALLGAWWIVWMVARGQRDEAARELCDCHRRWVPLDLRWARLCAVVHAVFAGDLSWASLSCMMAGGGDLLGWFVGVRHLRVAGDDEYYAHLGDCYERFGCVRGSVALLEVTVGPGLAEKWCPSRVAAALGAGILATRGSPQPTLEVAPAVLGSAPPF